MEKVTIEHEAANELLRRHDAWAQGYWKGLVDQDGRDRTKDPTRLQLDNAIIEGASVRGVNLHAAALRDCEFRHANLVGAYMPGDFRGSAFGGSFQGSTLAGGNFTACTFKDADLAGADLISDGSPAIFRGAFFCNVNLAGAKYFYKGSLANIRGAGWNAGSILPCGIPILDFVDKLVPQYIAATGALAPLARIWEAVGAGATVIDALYDTQARLECPIEHQEPIFDFLWFVHSGAFVAEICAAGRPAPQIVADTDQWLEAEATRDTAVLDVLEHVPDQS